MISIHITKNNDSYFISENTTKTPNARLATKPNNFQNGQGAVCVYIDNREEMMYTEREEYTQGVKTWI